MVMGAVEENEAGERDREYFLGIELMWLPARTFQAEKSQYQGPVMKECLNVGEISRRLVWLAEQGAVRDDSREYRGD